MKDFTQKFTDNLKDVLTRALAFVAEYGEGTIEPIHLLWSMAEQTGSAGAVLLAKHGIAIADFDSVVKRERTVQQRMIPGLSERSREVIERAVVLATEYKHSEIGTEHLMVAVLDVFTEDVKAFFKGRAGLAASIKKEAIGILTLMSPKDSIEIHVKRTEAQQEAHVHDEEELDEKESALEFFTKELTTEEVTKGFTPVIGRELETQRLVHILARKTKNNPILLGQPGVGKTALVEGLAHMIVGKTAPDFLKDMHIHQLDLASLLAGTMYRGEFESRMRQLIDEVEERDDVILFVDEIHMIMGTGATSGSLDAANMLKPALARGTIRCIGATTANEYKKHIEIDGALDRRFQPIIVDEPSKSETKRILQGLLPYYEAHHHVRYDDSAVDAAIELADQYFTGRFFPDKAIDVLDEAGAQQSSAKQRAVPKRNATKASKLEAQIKELEARLELAVTSKDKQTLDETLGRLEKELQQVSHKKPIGNKTRVKRAHIEDAVAHMKHIPVRTVRERKHLLLNLERMLNDRVFGQESVIKTIAHTIKRGHVGIGNRKRPLASFLFVGSSGVGKTHLAQTLAETLSPEKQAFLRLDMSEFSERFHTSKLIGAPAGYVGYREASTLADFVKHHPQSVLLFDEAEKAHPDVLNLFLQILDHGNLSDSAGNTVDFRNTIIIFTSNALDSTAHMLGFTDTVFKGADAKPKLKERFTGELLNRLDHICVFSELSTTAKQSIAQKHVSDLTAQLATQGISATIDQTVTALFSTTSGQSTGARDIKRRLESELEEKIVDHLLKRGNKQPIKVSAHDGKVTVE